MDDITTTRPELRDSLGLAIDASTAVDALHRRIEALEELVARIFELDGLVDRPDWSADQDELISSSIAMVVLRQRVRNRSENGPH